MSERHDFYTDGLRFHCTRCSMCCRFDTGYVFLSDADLRRLAAGLRESVETVAETWCKRVELGFVSRLSLREQPNNDCVFWIDGECSVYEFRPLQCRSYPFWPAHLGTRSEWDELQRECPGVNVGRRHGAEEIRGWLSAHEHEPLL